jgi:hypothetical protein
MSFPSRKKLICFFQVNVEPTWFLTESPAVRKYTLSLLQNNNKLNLVKLWGKDRSDELLNWHGITNTDVSTNYLYCCGIHVFLIFPFRKKQNVNFFDGMIQKQNSRSRQMIFWCHTIIFTLKIRLFSILFIHSKSQKQFD